MSSDLAKTEESELPDDVKAIVAKVQSNKDRWLTDSINLIRIQNLLIIFCGVIGFLCLKGTLVANFTRIIILIVVFSLANKCLNLRYGKKRIHCSGRDFERLEAFCDRRTINAAFDISLDDPKGKYAARWNDLMHNLLSQLTPSDSYLLSKDRKATLLNLVRSDGKGETLFALTVLSQVGDAGTLQALKRWKINHRLAKINLEVQKAMTDCIAAIKAREDTTPADSQLLRPSFLSDGAATYLRPVTHKVDEDADTLLRAETGEKE